MERTVKADGTVLVEGAVYAPTDPNSRALMERWIGKRVKVRNRNYWGTEMEAAQRFPAGDVMLIAALRMRNDP